MLFETIKIQNGKSFFLDYHQNRLNSSRFKLFGFKNRLELRLSPPKEGLFRCKVLYEKKIEDISYFSYTPKKIESLKVISSNIDYSFKYANRESFNTLLEKNSSFDEVIIEKNGYLTDTTISNIAFLSSNGWITPKKPLLEGTTRKRLIKKGFLIEKEIKKEEIKEYSKVALMNAMIGFKILNNIKCEEIIL